MIAWISSVPTPGQAKTFSVITAPESSAPNCSPTIVTTGSSALRSAWRAITVRSPTPLARAVRR